MSLKEIKDQVEREHPDWTSRQKLDEIHRLRKAEKAERAPAPGAAATPVEPAASVTTADADEKTAPISVPGAWAFLVVLVGGMELIGLAVWGDGFDQPDWYNGLHGLALILGIRAVYGAYKRRPTGQ